MICSSPSITAATQEAALRKAGAEHIVTLGRVVPKSWRDVVNIVREGDTVYVYGLAMLVTKRGEDELKPSDQAREILIEIHDRGATLVEVSTGRNSRDRAQRKAMTADTLKGLRRGNRSPRTGKKRGRPAVEWTDDEIKKAHTVWFSRDYPTNVIAERHLPSKMWNGKREMFNAKRAWNTWGPSGRPYKKSSEALPKRVQLKRTKGWRMPPNTVKVDRSSQWGNPFQVTAHTAEDAVRDFRTYVVERLENGVGYPLDALRGKNLACWCKLGAPCHADVLLELANSWSG